LSDIDKEFIHGLKLQIDRANERLWLKQYFRFMPGSSFGHIFRIHTFGESHGKGIGVVVDGCPAGLEIDVDYIQTRLDRRRPGQSTLTTARKESDTVEILSGVFEGKSTGAPIALFIPNKDHKPGDYDHLKDTFRPSHADFSYEAKYGFRDHRGGGRSSARETAARVAAGSIAMKLLEHFGIKLFAFVDRVGNLAWDWNINDLQAELIDSNPVRCPDSKAAGQMQEMIEEARDAGDTLGGSVACVALHVPAGLGEPVFDKLHADLAKAVMSINAVKGFEIGSGIEGTMLRGSEQNDVFEQAEEGIRTRTNNSGGVQGGISNGMPIHFRVAFKPVATLMKNQESVNREGGKTNIEGKGRHDPCVVPRAVPIVESMTALVLADHLLRQRSARIEF
jgi:chorismate synthase